MRDWLPLAHIINGLCSQRKLSGDEYNPKHFICKYFIFVTFPNSLATYLNQVKAGKESQKY